MDGWMNGNRSACPDALAEEGGGCVGAGPCARPGSRERLPLPQAAPPTIREEGRHGDLPLQSWVVWRTG